MNEVIFCFCDTLYNHDGRRCRRHSSPVSNHFGNLKHRQQRFSGRRVNKIFVFSVLITHPASLRRYFDTFQLGFPQIHITKYVQRLISVSRYKLQALANLRYGSYNKSFYSIFNLFWCFRRMMNLFYLWIFSLIFGRRKKYVSCQIIKNETEKQFVVKNKNELN